ncbi:tyrosine protein phosphatase [Lactobacillus sp. CC-MHH1034]|uniref:tyrosine-protein phosphatase n=1 Tax=Agrilactobacillus fermenti TaxID=2586909 RepID=UPI001E60310C|nr:CpsB/CapC family capsule biosynthesis tyrosine phosphatase [Agrilactobacillus fermenti]MCD2255873.1 tyrosine protein phosphatase [Agrilactobacillus fermenti]
MILVDLHCHILPGVDDGAKTLADSIALARVAVSQGIKYVLVTPHHMNGIYMNHPKDVRQLTNKLQKALNQANVPLKLFPGQEVHLTGDLLTAIDREDILFADANHHYLMLELPHDSVPDYTVKMVDELLAREIVPVIVHPERNRGLLENPDQLYELVSLGCLTQLTASSFVGVFGKKIQRFTEKIVRANLGFVFASDAHNLRGRNYKMTEAFKKLKQFGGKLAAKYQENAVRIINGESIFSPDIYRIRQQKKFWFFKKPIL